MSAFEETGPTDGSRLLACLRTWAGSGHRFHYLLRCDAGADQLPDRQRLGEGIDALDPPLPAAIAAALLQGWPPALKGLHRIELVPGRAWVSVAIGLKPSIQRAVDKGLVPPLPAGTADAIVVGAGLAGCALADSLIRRGWRVTVIEQRCQVGGAVAEVPLLAQHPALSPGEDRRSRLLVAALLASARLRGRLGDAFSWSGRFQPCPVAEARRRTAHVPSAVAESVDASVAAVHGVGGLQGIWYPQCAMADPQRWWQRVRRSPLLNLRCSTRVARIAGEPGAWRAEDSTGQVVGTAPVVVFANQAGAFPLAAMSPPASGRLRISRQQVAIGTAVAAASEATAGDAAAMAPGAAGRGARPTLSGATYRIEEAGVRCVAGPIRQGEADPLLAILTGSAPPSSSSPAAPDGAGYRWHLSAPAERLLLRDNLPMIGVVPDTAAIIASRDRFERNDRLPLPRRDGLYLLTGLGGRGLLWSVLGAEIIAARANGEPAIVEPDLLEAVDPARFLKRMLRRTRSADAGAGADPAATPTE